MAHMSEGINLPGAGFLDFEEADERYGFRSDADAHTICALIDEIRRLRARTVRVERGPNWSDTGQGVWVYVNNVLVWGWLSHIDGPISSETENLLQAIEAWTHETEDPTSP